METARRLGVFSLVLAFLLFLFFDQSETANLPWRDQLLVYGIIFSILGILILTRFRSRGKKSSRFGWIKNWLFKSSKKERRK